MGPKRTKSKKFSLLVKFKKVGFSAPLSQETETKLKKDLNEYWVT